MIEVSKLRVDFVYPGRKIEVLKGVTAVFREGRISGIVGESGCGKSVLGTALLRMLPRNALVSGQCLYKGRDLLQAKGKELRSLRRREIALIPQNPYESLNPSRRIGKILLDAIDPVSRRQARITISNMLEHLGFRDPGRVMDSYSFELSGGMNQRVLIALALLRSPRWVLADEPTKGLDPSLVQEMAVMFRDVASKIGSMLIISHDLRLAQELCDDLFVMYRGWIVERGSCAKILSKPAHPYTAGLLGALPHNGLVPIPTALREWVGDSGCPFYPRCSSAMPRCSTEDPDFYPTAFPDQETRCFLYARAAESV